MNTALVERWLTGGAIFLMFNFLKIIKELQTHKIAANTIHGYFFLNPWRATLLN